MNRDDAAQRAKLIEMYAVEEVVVAVADPIVHGVFPSEAEAEAFIRRQLLETPEVERRLYVVPRTRDGWKIARTPEEVEEALALPEALATAAAAVEEHWKKLQEQFPNATTDDQLAKMREFLDSSEFTRLTAAFDADVEVSTNDPDEFEDSDDL